MTKLLTLILEFFSSFFKRTKPPVLDVPEPVLEPVLKTPAQRLLEIAERYENTDPSPTDPVDDVVGCVDSLTNVIRETQEYFPKSYYTPVLLKDLLNSPFFDETNEVAAGYIIINATGTGNGTIRGHCGIIGKGGWIWANDSRTGLWTKYYNLDSWRKRYRIAGGMPTRIFKPV